MQKTNIVLIGFMGSGKSVTARQLAQVTKKKIVSTDQLIEAREGRTISDIFAAEGEMYFRKVEKEIVRQAAAEKNRIIDCGGGVVLEAQNMESLRENGIIVYLSASPQVILQRVKDHKHRPLLNVPDPLARVKEILAERKSLYEAADYTVDTDGKSAQEVAGEILRLVNWSPT